MKHGCVTVKTFGKSSQAAGPLLFVETGRGGKSDEAFFLVCEASPAGRRLFEAAIAEYKRGEKIRTPGEYVTFLERRSAAAGGSEGASGENPASFAAGWLRGRTNTWASAGRYSFLSVGRDGSIRDGEEASGVRDLEPGENVVVGSTEALSRVRERLESPGQSVLGISSETLPSGMDEPSVGPSPSQQRVSTSGRAPATQLEIGVGPSAATVPAAVSTVEPTEAPAATREKEPRGELESVLSSLSREAGVEPVLLIVYERTEAGEHRDRDSLAAARRYYAAAAASRGRPAPAPGARRLSVGVQTSGGLLGRRPLIWLLPLAGLTLVVVFALVILPALRQTGPPAVEDISEAPEPVAVPSAEPPTQEPTRSPTSEIPRPITLSPKWRKTFRAAVTSSPTVAEGRVYFGCRDGNLYCLDAETGEEVWKSRVGAGIGSSPVVSKGNVFVGSYDGRFRSFDAASGNKNWDFKTAGKIVSSPSVASGRVLFGSYDRNLYCLSEQDGKLRWKHEAAGLVWSSPCVSKGRVFFGSADGSFYCLSLDSGKQHWREVAPGGVYSSPAVEGEVVCFGSLGKLFHFLDVSDGKELFRVKAEGEVRASPVLAGRSAYVGADDGFVRCISVDRKGVSWSFRAKRAVRSKPFLSDGLLFVTSYDGRLYALESSSGEKMGSFGAGAEIYSSPAVWEGKVYFGTNNGDFYCLQQEKPSP
ncbi:MAG: hypothetical protein AMJ46_10315 [Latescibacteria bacterium DG_63]|nr:MAG: hypothetical protein AMJ46_10315 [Latescibacteria bacterium DG_63]